MRRRASRTSSPRSKAAIRKYRSASIRSAPPRSAPTTKQISDQVVDKVRGSVATRYSFRDRKIDVLVRAQADQRGSVDDIRNLIVGYSNTAAATGLNANSGSTNGSNTSASGVSGQSQAPARRVLARAEMAPAAMARARRPAARRFDCRPSPRSFRRRARAKSIASRRNALRSCPRTCTTAISAPRSRKCAS